MSCSKRAICAGLVMIIVAILIGCQAKQEAKKPPRPRFNPQAVAVEARAQDIAAGIRRYQRDVGQYPQKLDDLFSSDAKDWKGPYVGSGPPVIPDGQSHGAQDLLTDLWGQPFEYVSGTESPQVVSSGPDKQRGTPDDIIVPVTPGGSPGETNASH